MTLTHLGAYYFAVINIITFYLYWDDKKRAKKGKWRIPENTLLLFALIGGSIGALAGMKVFHHKTRHWKFKILVPLFLVLHMAALYVFLG
jgi:uncharacterized membrane protein YsdA (DUF1294 family)